MLWHLIQVVQTRFYFYFKYLFSLFPFRWQSFAIWTCSVEMSSFSSCVLYICHPFIQGTNCANVVLTVWSMFSLVRTPFLTVRTLLCRLRKMSKHPRLDTEASSSQVDLELAPTLSMAQHQVVTMSRSIIIEWQIALAYLNDLRFEDQMLPEVVEHTDWVLFLQRTSYISMDMV